MDAQSVPLVRGLLRQALEHLGVAASGVDDILLALTEACANVVHHAGEVGEQWTMFFRDPAGNALEFKAFADEAQLFAH